MKISLLYTSRRPDEVARTVARWLHTARNPAHLEFIFTADQDDRMTALAMRHAVEFLHRSGFSGVGPFPSGVPGTCVKGWNLAAEKATGDVLIAIADDFSAPEGWDAALMGAAEPQWWEKDAAVLVGDGIARTALCMTLAIMTRARYERIGYLFHPAYASMYCDNDIAEHAAHDGALIGATHLCFPHAHFVIGARKRDGVDVQHSSEERLNGGRRLFEARKSLSFPIDAGPRARKEARGGIFNPIAYVLTAGDDFATVEACERLHAEGVRNFFFSFPDTLWNGKPVLPGIARLELYITELARSANVFRQRITVEKYRKGVKLFSDIEGRARNAALSEIEAHGFRDVLIVDDDEIWPHGLLARVRNVVKETGAPYIHADALPVVGAPGLIVEGAMDRVGIYIDAARNRFLSGRSPYRGGAVVSGSPVIHFTACRRTVAEIAEKMRTSAHYNDPDYGFEQWIRSRLPSLRPGSRDVHMYRKGKNVWPHLRAWTMEERSQIPAYLAQFIWT